MVKVSNSPDKGAATQVDRLGGWEAGKLGGTAGGKHL